MDHEEILRNLFANEASRMRALNPEKKQASGLVKLIGYCFAIVIVAFLLAVCTLYGVFANGFIAMKLWQWFLVPLHMPSVSLLQAAGVLLLVRMFTCHFRPFIANNGAKTEKDEAIAWIWALGYPWFMLLVGFVLHHFV